MPPPWLRAELPLTVVLVTVSVCVFQLPPPSPSEMALWPQADFQPSLHMVTIRVALWLKVPPTTEAELPLNVLLLITSGGWFSIPPPPYSVELPLSVLLLNVPVPSWLMMPPPAEI